jgi:hypothetical protein
MATVESVEPVSATSTASTKGIAEARHRSKILLSFLTMSTSRINISTVVRFFVLSAVFFRV